MSDFNYFYNYFIPQIKHFVIKGKAFHSQAIEWALYLPLATEDDVTMETTGAAINLWLPCR